MKKIDGRRKITLAQRDEIIRRHHNGEGASALAKEFGLRASTIYAMSQAALIGKPILTRDQVLRVQKQLGLGPAQRGGKNVAAKRIKKGRRARLTPEQREEVVRRRDAGERATALGKEFGVTRQAIDSIMKKRAEAATAQPLHLLELKHLKWLKSKLTHKGVPTGQLWSKEEVRAMLHKKFGVNFNMRSHFAHLRWMGVEIGEVPSPRQRSAYLKKRAKQLKAEAAAVLAAIKVGKAEMPYRSRYARGVARREHTDKN